jgi:sporulation protein YlmC with PRC-barrel domain
MNERIESRLIIGKPVVSKSGKKMGIVKDLIFDVRSGEIINLAIKDATSYAKEFRLDRDEEGDPLLPYSAVISVGDFVVVSEEDIV